MCLICIEFHSYDVMAAGVVGADAAAAALCEREGAGPALDECSMACTVGSSSKDSRFVVSVCPENADACEEAGCVDDDG